MKKKKRKENKKNQEYKKSKTILQSAVLNLQEFSKIHIVRFRQFLQSRIFLLLLTSKRLSPLDSAFEFFITSQTQNIEYSKRKIQFLFQ